MSTTVRRKFGSWRSGEEMRSCPCSESTASPYAQRRDSRERDRDTGELGSGEALPERDVGEEDGGDRVERAEHRDEREQPVRAREREEGVGRDVRQPDRHQNVDVSDPERGAAVGREQQKTG